MHKKILSPAINLLNRLTYTKKFTLLWVMSLIAVAVMAYSLFVSLDRVIQPSQRQLEGLALIQPVSQTIQAIQLHRGILAALLGGGETMRDRRAAQEEKAAAAFKVMEGKLPASLTSGDDFRAIRENWERLRKEGVNWKMEANFAAHSSLIEQLQSFKVSVADKYLLTLDPELASFYLIDTGLNKLPHALEHLGQIRAYGTGILTKKQLSEQQKTKLNILMAELDTSLNDLRVNLDKTGYYNPTVRDSLRATSDDITRSARQITDLVKADILTGRLATAPDAYLEMATAAIDRSYTQMYDSLLPTAEALIRARIAQARKTLYTNTGIATLVFLLVVYLSVSIYYAIIGSIQSLVHSLRAFAEGNLYERVKLGTRDELSLVGDSFNEMAHQFSALLEIHREDEARLRATIETAMDAVVQMDAAGIITGWNSHAEKIFGWSREEAVGRVLSETIIPPQYREAHQRGLERFLLTGEGSVLNSRIELVGLHRDGHEFPVELSIAPIKVVGKVAGQTESNYEFSAFVRDITEYKRHEREMRIAAVAFDAQEGITVTDENGVIIRANHTFTTITGYSAEEAIGNTPRILKSGRQDAEFYRHMWENLRRDKFWQGEIWNKRKNGEIYPEWLTITAVVAEDGKTNNYVAIFIDITERKRAETEIAAVNTRLQQANAQIEEERAHLAERVMARTAQLMYANLAKDSFLATMSHEIRTPLGGLLGMLELISLSRLDREQREMLQAARDSGRSLLRIVNDILDWSKIEAGKLKLAPQAAAIPEVLKGVVSTYSSLASTKSLLLRQRVDSKLAAAHIFDPLRLSQILNNFTSNAVKFTEQGTIEISAELVARHEGAEQVRFCVKDSGVGISPEQQTHLFKYYEQGSADTARMYGGTGLGLVICHSLAELMKGTVSMESTLGVGSTFCFTISLPVASPAEQRDMQLRQAREESNDRTPVVTPLVEDGKLVSALVVDDHPVNRKLLKQQLIQLGLHTEDAASGIAALSLWQAGHFDIVITDCHMPEMDGYELTRSIREIEQRDGRQRSPIIAWTANVLAEEERRCHAAGMDDVLTKPTDLAELKSVLLKWLDKADQLAAAAPPSGMTQDHSLDVGRAMPDMVGAAHPTDSNPAAAETAIDFSVLEKIARSRSAQVEMLHEFNLENRSDIANLKAALKDGNPAAVARSAHRIKGASRMVGALELEGICMTIEKAAAQGDLNGVWAVADTALDAVVESLEAAISRFIGGQ